MDQSLVYAVQLLRTIFDVNINADYRGAVGREWSLLVELAIMRINCGLIIDNRMMGILRN